MLTNFLDAFFAKPTVSQRSASESYQQQHAVAVLMLDVARSDWETAPEEKAAIQQSLQNRFDLSAEEASELLTEAAKTLDQEVSMHAHLAALNQQWSPDERRLLLDELWSVAFADGVLSKYEEHTIRRLAELLHVPHREFIKAKLRHSDR